MFNNDPSLAPTARPAASNNFVPKARSIGSLRFRSLRPLAVATVVLSSVAVMEALAPGAASASTVTTPPATTAAALSLPPAFGQNVLLGAGMPNLASLMQLQGANDAGNAATVSAQIAADQQKQAAQRWTLQMNTQTTIFAIVQDITANKAKTQDRAISLWDQFIRG